jgi:hypothetical protein
MTSRSSWLLFFSPFLSGFSPRVAGYAGYAWRRPASLCSRRWWSSLTYSGTVCASSSQQIGREFIAPLAAVAFSGSLILTPSVGGSLVEPSLARRIQDPWQGIRPIE